MKTFSLFNINIDIYNKKHNPHKYICELESFISNSATNSLSTELMPLVKKFSVKKATKDNLESVLVINTISKGGGAAKVAYSIAIKAAKKYSVTIATGENIQEQDDNNISLISTTTSEEKKLCAVLNKKTGLLDFFFKKSLELKSRENIKNSDVIHLHNLHGEYFSPFALPELTALKPTIWTLHDTCSFTGHCGNFMDCNKWEDEECNNCPYVSLYQSLPFDTAHEIYKTKEKIYATMADDITLVAPSQWLVDKVKKSILKRFDIKLIPNGIDEHIFKPYNKQEIRKELKLPQNKKILLFSCAGGTASPWKGGEYIEKVYNTLKKNKDMFFLVIGGNKQELIAKNYLQLPYVTDERELAKYYNAADLFIYPSKADNHPLSVIEALACTLPVITFNTGGIPEIVEHMKTGYIAPQFDVTDFIKGINLFLSDDNLRSNAGIKARKIVEEKFTQELMNSRYLDLYNEVFEKRK